MDLRTALVPGLLELKNPVMSAAGTFGSGLEYRPYGDISQLGGIITNGLTLRPCMGNPMPRIAETPSGILSSVGTQNDGAEYFIDKRRDTSMSAKIILKAVSDFHTDYPDGKPVYCMDFLYENEFSIQDFLMKSKEEIEA